MPTPDVSSFIASIEEWFSRHKRTLPWRDIVGVDDDQKAYMVLVSEVMLQQTQVSRVIIIFRNFLETFPTAVALAAATNAQVILAWRGMGYNSRALRLRDAAKCVVEEHGGRFPRDMASLLEIKGIGPYTAAAICNFAFHIPQPCIDTNIRRILHRVFIGPENGLGEWSAKDSALVPLAEKILLDIEAPQDWHAALMDFGSLVCTKRSPKCDICPLNRSCASAFRVPVVKRGTAKEREKREPGRVIAGTYTPNRIVRGRVVEALRDHPKGLALEELGPLSSIDWNASEHMKWLADILSGLERDGLICRENERYLLS